MPPAIAILGAGPSGLTLARLLEVKGIDYVIFERDRSSSSVGQGGTLDIRTNGGQLALQECGLFEEFKQFARYDGQAMKVVDRKGEVIWDKKADGEDRMPEIDRKELRRILLNSVPEDKVHWDGKVSSIQREADGLMTIRFENGKTEKGFKLVVGADGAWSKARELLTSAKPVYSGISYLNTTISISSSNYETLSARVGLGSYMALSSGKSIIAQRMGDGSYNVYAGLPLPENWAKQNTDLVQSTNFRETLVTDKYSDWSSDITDLIKKSDGAFHSWPLYSLPSDALSWKPDSSLTLLGDAAHIGLPNGEGVNCAMFDSLQLAQAIIECGVDNLDKAVKTYEEKMLPRAVEHIKDGEQMTAQFYEPESPRGFKEWLASMGVTSE